MYGASVVTLEKNILQQAAIVVGKNNHSSLPRYFVLHVRLGKNNARVLCNFRKEYITKQNL
jgi:hypothetical protein